jgi:hypothetical protein
MTVGYFWRYLLTILFTRTYKKTFFQALVQGIVRLVLILIYLSSRLWVMKLILFLSLPWLLDHNLDLSIVNIAHNLGFNFTLGFLSSLLLLVFLWPDFFFHLFLIYYIGSLKSIFKNEGKQIYSYTNFSRKFRFLLKFSNIFHV